MWKFVLTAAVASLVGCATLPSSKSSENQWTAYQAQIRGQRDSGALTAVTAEDALSAKYHELYGRDPTMEGVFAYSRELYAAADAGKLPLPEADALAQARLDEVMQRREARAAYHEWMDSRYLPPDEYE